MIEFYYYPSTNPAKVALLLEEAGLEYSFVPIDSRKGEQMTPAFLAINPNGKMPAIVDDGVRVFDSTAILIHLARKTGRFLAPDGSPEHAETLSWLMLIATGLGPFCGQLMHFMRYAPEPREYGIRRYGYEARRHWSLLDAQLAKHPYLAGDEYSIADMSLWGWKRSIPILFGEKAWDEFPNAQRLIEEIDARPAAARAEALVTRHQFKSEFDEEAHRHLFAHGGTSPS